MRVGSNSCGSLSHGQPLRLENNVLRPFRMSTLRGRPPRFLRLAGGTEDPGIRLRRDSWVSVMYAEELNSTTSSVTLQRTDRHGILGQKSSHCQMSL